MTPDDDWQQQKLSGASWQSGGMIINVSVIIHPSSIPDLFKILILQLTLLNYLKMKL